MSTASHLDPLLELEDVEYSYAPDIPALDGVSLAVPSGARIAILGANGCGKSTLLKLLAGLLFAQRGTYRAFGRRITESSISRTPFGMYFRRAVGIVFQNADAQLFNPTVEDEVAFGPGQLQEPAQVVRVKTQRLLELFGLGRLAGRPPFALSGGEKKKVALASVLVMDPQVLLLDEPTAGLDPRASRLLVDLIVSQGDGRTVLTATNDLHIVSEICDRALIFGEDHRFLAAGRPEDVLRDRALLRAANLIHRHRHAHEDGWHEHEHEHDSLFHWHRHDRHEATEGGRREGDG